MGSKVKKLIPKEVRPAVPFVAAYFGGPALGAKLGIKSAALSKAITAGLAAKAQGDDTKTALRAAALAGAPDAISGGLGKFEQAYGFGPADVKALSSASQLTKATPMQELATIAGKGKQAIEGAGLLKTVGAQTAVEAGARAAELNEKALRDYEAQLREQGITDSAQRRAQIFGYFQRAGYDDDEVNSFLDKYGYANGGRVKMEGGGLAELIDYLKGLEDEDDGFDVGNLDTAIRGLDTAFGRPTMGAQPQPMGITPGFGNMPRMKLAKGGVPNVMAMRKTIAELIASGVIDEEDVEEAVAQIRNQAINSMKAPGFANGGSIDEKFMDLVAELREQGFTQEQAIEEARERLSENMAYGGRVKRAEGGIMNLGGREMDMRGGGFIPIGAKERADDVPARLSKNEFVMTADAVRGAGNGSINKGAKRMYDLMNRLESKV